MRYYYILFPDRNWASFIDPQVLDEPLDLFGDMVNNVGEYEDCRDFTYKAGFEIAARYRIMRPWMYRINVPVSAIPSQSLHRTPVILI